MSAMAAGAAGAPRRVAVAIQPDLMARPTSLGTRQIALRGYLLATLSRETKIEVVDAERVDVICSPFELPVYDIDADFIRRRLAAAVRVDAIVYIAIDDDGSPSVTVTQDGHAARQAQKAEAETSKPSAELPASFLAAAEFVLRELKLPAGVEPLAMNMQASAECPDPFKSWWALAALLPDRSLSMEPTTSTARGSERAWDRQGQTMAMATQLWSANGGSDLLAARVLATIYRTRPEPPKEISERHRALAIAAMRVVLGKSMESVAYPLLPLMSGPEMEALLQTVARPLVPAKEVEAAADELFDDAMTEKAGKHAVPKSGLVANPKDSSALSKAARMGALRALGCIPTSTAVGTLVEAAKSRDPAVREAVANGLARRLSDATVAALKAMTDDADTSVARAAMVGLSQHGIDTPKLLPVLRQSSDAVFAASPFACAAYGKLANADDRARLAALSSVLHGDGRLAIIKARLRLGDLSSADVLDLLRDDDPGVIKATIHHIGSAPIAAELLPVIRGLANDPDASVAGVAYEVLARHSQGATGSLEDRLFRVECGSPYARVSVLTGIAGRRDIKPELELLNRAVTNALPIVRFEALRLMDEHYPAHMLDVIRAGLTDAHRLVRLQAATLASEHAMSELTDEIKTALLRERSIFIKPALEVALARATGTALPPIHPSARAADDTRRLVWSGAITDKNLDYTPIEAFLCKNYSPLKEMPAHRKTVYNRTLWGLLPTGDTMMRLPRALDELWCNTDGAPDETLDGFDLRTWLGEDWDNNWRDFCRDANVDPGRIAGDAARLSVYEKRAYDVWAFDRGVSGFNLMADLLKLKTRYLRPHMQVSTWGPGLSDIEYTTTRSRWRFDLSWRITHVNELAWLNYDQARMCRTIWPTRSHVYDVPIPGGLPDFWVRFDSPMPSAFIYKSEHDVFTHTLLAWLSGAHVCLNAWWSFNDYRTVEKGPYPPGVGVSLTTAGPSTEAIEKGIELAFKDAPIEGRPKADAALEAASKPGGGGAGGNAKGIDLEGKDVTAPMKNAQRVGIRLMQKHMYDCARIFASLPRYDPHCDTLMIQPGNAPLKATAISATAPPVIAGKELAGEYDLLPGINLVAQHNLGGYRLIIVHNAALLRDETIRALTAWLRDTPGVLLIHQNLTSDHSAEASTDAQHTGILHESWPWEKDMTIRPADMNKKRSLVELAVIFNAQNSGGGASERVSAETAMSTADCHNAKAVALAQVDGKVVLARWRDPAFKGVVVFDGLRSPSKPYVDRLAGELNALAGSGVGRKVGDAVIKEVTTEYFHVVADPGYGDAIKRPIKVTGVDVFSGVVDPTIGPGPARNAHITSAIVPIKDYFHRYLACTPTIAALGEREFRRASKDDRGLQLQNAGLIQIASRTPLAIVRADGSPLPALPFEFEWIFAGGKEGVAIYRTPAGSNLIFVRSTTPILVHENR